MKFRNCAIGPLLLAACLGCGSSDNNNQQPANTPAVGGACDLLARCCEVLSDSNAKQACATVVSVYSGTDNGDASCATTLPSYQSLCGAGAGGSGSPVSCDRLAQCCNAMKQANAKQVCSSSAATYKSQPDGETGCASALQSYQASNLCGSSSGGAGGTASGGAGQGGAGSSGGSAGVGSSCPGELTNCSGSCTDLKTSTEHCGTCAKPCGSNETCNQGTCDALPRTCPCPVESYCELSTNSCKVGCLVDTDCSTARYCDTGDRLCKAGCRADQPCGQNEQCNLGVHQCECVAGMHRCSGACVSESSVEHCGSICEPCPGVANAATTCDGKSCGVSCNSGYHLCNGSCLSNQSTESCGTRCSPCPTDPNGDAVCSAGQCQIQCHSNAHKENGKCVLNETCAGQDCSGHGTCQVQNYKTLCGCDIGYVAQGMACVQRPCQKSEECPLEFSCEDGVCQPGCADESRCPPGNACRSESWTSWQSVCISNCHQSNSNYNPYPCSGAPDWTCLGNSACRYLCSVDTDCDSGDKCATFAFDWTTERACVSSCTTNPSECGDAYNNGNGGCSCASDGLCRDPQGEECRLPSYSDL